MCQIDTLQEKKHLYIEYVDTIMNILDSFTNNYTNKELFSAKERRIIVRKYIIYLCIQYTIKHRLNKTDGIKKFCDAWNSSLIKAESWIYTEKPYICKNTIFNWIKKLEQHGEDSLSGKYGHRRGTGIIDSNVEMKEFIIKSLEKNINTKEILKNINEKIISYSEKPLSLRVLQRWIQRYKNDKINNSHLSIFKNIKKEDNYIRYEAKLERLESILSNIYEEIKILKMEIDIKRNSFTDK